VTEWFGKGVKSEICTLLCFDLNLSSQNLWTPTYSNHQQFLYDTITDLREKEMNDVQIANWLNDNGHKTPRGHSFRNNHVHSIVKKRRKRLNILEIEPKQSLSNIVIKYSTLG
jgi:hypothetical protein